MKPRRYFHVRNNWRNDYVWVVATGPLLDPPPRAFRTKMYWNWYPRRPNAAGWALTVWIVWRVLRAGGGT